MTTQELPEWPERLSNSELDVELHKKFVLIESETNSLEKLMSLWYQRNPSKNHFYTSDLRCYLSKKPHTGEANGV